MKADLATLYGQERLPRYTSYPTAPHFSGTVGSENYGQWLKALPQDEAASLYLHVPFCRKMCTYCGCHTTITGKDEPIAAYMLALRSEIELVARHIGRRIDVAHIHFGGGTPTIMPPEEFIALMKLLRQAYGVLPTAEVAIEIDPRTLSMPMVEALALGGVNRASLGVQSFDPVVQKAINRIQTFEVTAGVVNNLRGAGISRCNFDLIYGLPYQTVASCQETVRQCLELRPNRFSVFGYAHVPAFKKHQRKINEATLPDSLDRYEQACAIADALQEAGYVRVGLDHFALPDDPIAIALRERRLRRNFQGYTTDSATYLIGFGASAIGHLPQGYAQNKVLIGAYQRDVTAGRFASGRGYALTPDDRLRAEIIERIMCDLSVDLGVLCARHGSAADAVLTSVPRLQKLVSDGVARLDGTTLTVADDSRFLVRSVAAAFDAHLEGAQKLHSRAV